jgi:hypothetical protein
MERVYLDICSLKPPIDDQRRPRAREEAMAVAAIVGRAEAGEIAGLGFAALDALYLAFAERAEAAPGRVRARRHGRARESNRCADRTHTQWA